MSYINVTFMFAKRTHINTEAKRENWQLSSTGAILAFIILVQQDGKKKERRAKKTFGLILLVPDFKRSLE